MQKDLRRREQISVWKPLLPAIEGEQPFELIIVNLDLENYDGLRLCSQLRSLERTRGLPILARIRATAVAGCAPEEMGIGPVPAVRKLLARLGLDIQAFDVIELNEAFAAQGLAVTRELGLADDSSKVNPNGGAIALGHPLGMSGNRLVLTAVHQLEKTGGRLALATLCVGVGQGVALAIERV